MFHVLCQFCFSDRDELLLLSKTSARCSAPLSREGWGLKDSSEEPSSVERLSQALSTACAFLARV